MSKSSLFFKTKTKAKFDFINDCTNYELSFIDHAGGDISCENSNVVILIYDVLSKSSLDNVLEFHSQNKKIMEDKIIFLVGNKMDLVSEKKKRAVPIKKGEAFADEMDAIFREISVKSGNNITELFEELISEFVSKNAVIEFEKSKELGQKTKGRGGLFGSIVDNNDVKEDIKSFKKSK
jgi:GTPase SAR1 family protein